MTETLERAGQRHVQINDFCRTMSHLAKCVGVTTALGPDGPTGCTTTSMMSLSIQPPSVLMSLRTGGQTLRDVLAAGRFAINMLATSQENLVHRFATGPPCERFDGVAHSIVDGVPLVTGCASALVCEVSHTLTTLDHTLIVGTVLALRGPDKPPLVLLDGQAHTAVPANPQAEEK